MEGPRMHWHWGTWWKEVWIFGICQLSSSAFLLSLQVFFRMSCAIYNDRIWDAVFFYSLSVSSAKWLKSGWPFILPLPESSFKEAESYLLRPQLGHTRGFCLSLKLPGPATAASMYPTAASSGHLVPSAPPPVSGSELHTSHLSHHLLYREGSSLDPFHHELLAHGCLQVPAFPIYLCGPPSSPSSQGLPSDSRGGRSSKMNQTAWLRASARHLESAKARKRFWWDKKEPEVAAADTKDEPWTLSS